MTREPGNLYECPIKGCDSKAFWMHAYFAPADGSPERETDGGAGEWRANYMCMSEKEHIGRTRAPLQMLTG